MIRITKATRKQIKYFNEKEWHGVDIEHYGKPIQWIDQSFIFKATEGGEVVGTSTGKFESGVVYVDTLMVGVSMRGKGIGQKLIKKVEDYGRKSGAHKIHLITGKDWKIKEDQN